MGLSTAFNSSVSGLSAVQVWSETTANNIANANTEGYVAKTVTMSTVDGVVYVSDFRREVDASLDRMLRLDTAKMAREQAIFEGIEEYTAILGQPEDEISPATKLNNFQISLTSLANTPDDAGLQRAVLDDAERLAASIRDASDTLEQVRYDVTAEIRYDVNDLNEMMYQVADLNQRILQTESPSLELSTMQDEMGRLIDSMSSIMDLRVSQAANGMTNIYTSNGTPLVEGRSVQDVTYNQGTGSLYAGQVEITPGQSGNRGFENGSLAGLFELQDEILPEFQLQLDEMARSLIEGFEDQDASLDAGQAGLFTDDGFAYDSANLDGLASRLQVNDAVKPEEGGSLSLIRDGIGATEEGDSGDPTQINAFLDFFSQPLTVDSGTDLPSGMTIQEYAVNMVTQQQVARTDAETSYVAARTSAEIVDASRQAVQGVNIDQELIQLSLIEQSYAANAQMMQAIIAMIDTLLEAV